MPLHDLSYQRFTGVRTSRFQRSFAMARQATALLLKQRSFLLLLAVCWIPFVARAAQIYAARFPQAFPFVTVDARMWQDFLSQQVFLLPVILVALYTGASAVSKDLSTGAFVAYLSKPISRVDYVVAKALPVAATLLSITLVPALALLMIQLFVTEELKLFTENPLLPISITLYSVWMSVYFTLSVLAISSLTRSPRVAGAGFGALALGSKVVFFTTLSRLGLEPPAFLSMVDVTIDLGHVFFGNASSARTPFLSTVAMVFLMLASVAVLRWRLGSAEAAS